MTEAAIRKKPGMVSVKEMPLLQDGPPPGGFPPVRYARRIPSKGPSAAAIFLTTFGAFAWGMYQVGQGNKIRRYILLVVVDFCASQFWESGNSIISAFYAFFVIFITFIHHGELKDTTPIVSNR